MTRWEKLGWLGQAALLVVTSLNAFGLWRHILAGFSLGAGCGVLAMSLICYPMVCRRTRERDIWIHNAMTAKAVLESLADIMEDGGDGKRVH